MTVISEAINYQNIDNWNNENPECSYSEQQVKAGLEEGIMDAVEGIIESFLENYSENRFCVETDYITSDAVNDTDAIDSKSFQYLVLRQIASCTKKFNY